MRWAGNAARTLVAATLVAPIAIGINAAYGYPPSTAWSNDHLLVVVTAGSQGAQGLSYDIHGPVVFTGKGPRLMAIGGGYRYPGQPPKENGGILGVEAGGGPLDITTTKGLGGQRLRLQESPFDNTIGTFGMSVSGDIPAHGVLIDLLITGNGRFPDLSVQHFHVSKGSATFRVIQAAGSVVVPVGDPAADGFAVDALTAGVGMQTTVFTAKRGIAGGFATGGTGNSTDTWQAPDNQGSRWVNAGATSTGLPSFAGPPGQWQLGWSGYDVSNPGAPIAYFWTPVGNYWPMLRCSDCLQTPL